MAMRLDVDFAKPLNREQKLALTLAVAALAKSERVRFTRDAYGAVVTGEALSARRLRECLAEAGLTAAEIRSSLVESDDTQVDDVPSDGKKERVRPIGR